MDSGPRSRHSGIIQSSEIHLAINNSDWTIPEQGIETIYKIGSFNFKTTFSIKFHEETISINEKFQTIPLLSPKCTNCEDHN